MPQGLPHNYVSYLIVVAVLALIVRRAFRSRRVKVDQLWIIPTLLVALAVYVIAQAPPHDMAGIAGLVLATLLGAAVGWQRGKLTRISLDPDTGILTSKASPLEVVLILGLFVVRFGVRIWMQEHPGQGQAFAVAADGLLLFGWTTVIVARLEMWLRCRRLIAAGAGQA